MINDEKVTCPKCSATFSIIEGILVRTYDSGGILCYRMECPHCHALQNGFWEVVRKECRGML